MILVTLQDLIKSKGYSQLKAELLALLKDYGFSATDWNTGSESDVLLNVESKSLEELWAIVSEIAKGMHLDTATGGWLTLLAKSQYNVERIPSEFTRGIATFSIIGNATRTISAGSVIVTDGLGHTYVTDNSAPVTINLANPSAEVPILAQVVGSDYNVAPGVITKIYQGPADINVVNQGAPTVASVLGTYGFTIPSAGPFNVNMKALRMLVTYTALDGSIVEDNPINIIFPANYPTMNDLVTYLNGVSFFNGLLTASNDVGYLRITTKQKGPVSKITVKFTGGTANLILGFSDMADTTSFGGYTTDYPATVYSAYLNAPYNVNGLQIKFSYTNNGLVTTPSVNYMANYPDLTSLINATNAALTGSNLQAYNDNDRLAIRTGPTGPGQLLIIDTTGSANVYFGWSTDALNPTKANGYSSWITTEGRDEETDDSVKSRCRKKWAITGMGTRDAFETWAREASTAVVKVAIYANQLNGVPKAGAVTIYLAGLNGGVSSSVVTAVYNYILPKMPIMSDLYVGSVNAITVFYSGILQILRKSATPENLTKVKNALTKYSQSLNIGNPVKRETIIAYIYNQFDPNDVVSVNLVDPASTTVTCQKNEVIVLQEDTIKLLKMIAV